MAAVGGKPRYVVYATHLDDRIYFLCPFCWSSYKKDGNPAKRAKRVVHTHSPADAHDSEGTNRFPHCRKYNHGFESDFPFHLYREFNIRLNSHTKTSPPTKAELRALNAVIK